MLNYWLPHEKWSVSVQGKKVCKKFSSQLYEATSQQPMIKFWHKRRNLPSSDFQKVNWTAIGKAAEEIPQKHRHWITKHATGICGVNEMLHKWKKRQDPFCPRCGQIETSSHVWKCNGSASHNLWISSIRSLVDWMKSINTSPVIIKCIEENLLKWQTDQPRNGTRSTLELSQDLLGWDYFLEGFLSTQWADTQDQYYKSLGKNNNGQRWATEIVKKLWSVAWDIWLYRNGIASEANTQHTHRILDNTIQTLRSTALVTNIQTHIYSESTANFLSKATIGTKRSWITTHNAISLFPSKNKKQKIELKGMQQTLNKFLSR
jgi:hypothetical protein